MNSFVPSKIEPYGQHNPLLKQKLMESVYLANYATYNPSVAAALKILAPSV